MTRKKVKGRFFIFLLLIGLVAFFGVRYLLNMGGSEALVMLATTKYTSAVDAVVVREETVASYEGSGRIVYIASEGSSVAQGDEIMEVYSAGYSEKELAKLETVRQSIRTYIQTMLDNIVDKELDRLENNVQAKALELKQLVRDQSMGNFLNIEQQLTQALVARQDYLRQNRREDNRLNSLFDEEASRITSLASWKKTEIAQRNGVVSFYLDGCERFLRPDNLEKITISDVRAVLAGNTPVVEESSRLTQDVYRLVTPDVWTVLFLSTQQSWYNEQTFSFQFEGYDDIIYDGKVVRVQKMGNETMAQVEVHAPVGPILNFRSGRANVGIDVTGLSVPAGAITVQNGQSGVWLNDVPGGTFIPVDVLSSDSRNAIIKPLVEGSLTVGNRVKVN